MLSATTAFGKTVTAIGLIAKHSVNTLILVHTKALLDQWVQRIKQFLVIYDAPEEVRCKLATKGMYVKEKSRKSLTYRILSYALQDGLEPTTP